MEQTQQGILTLIRSAITGEKLPLPEAFDIEKAYAQIQRHQITTIAYEGAVRCGVDKTLPGMQKLFFGYLKHLALSERQMEAVHRLSAAFTSAEIDHLLLKGSLLKAMYPKPELRIMGDADILIRQTQYDRIKPLMEQLGYTEKATGPYDYTWSSQVLHLELHYRLASPADRDFSGYFGDGWQRAKPESENSHRYGYTAEDQLIYLFMHFTKHYRDSGIGLKHAIDLWLFHNKYENLNMSYLENELRTLCLWEFYQNIRTMLDVWFMGKTADEKTAYITDVIFRNGAFGTVENYEVSASLRAAKANGGGSATKMARFFQLAFPSLELMQIRYTCLKKAPCLLPFCWAARWVRILLFKRDNLKAQTKRLEAITPDKIETHRQALSYVGLEFNFEE